MEQIGGTVHAVYHQSKEKFRVCMVMTMFDNKWRLICVGVMVPMLELFMKYLSELGVLSRRDNWSAHIVNTYVWIVYDQTPKIRDNDDNDDDVNGYVVSQ